MTDTEMLRTYEAHSPAHVYALGFVHAHMLYVAKLSFNELCAFVKLDRASSKKGGFLKLRIRMTAAQRCDLSAKAELLGSDKLLRKDPAHNQGENFERELCERWTGKAWVKDSVPFYVRGDLQVEGVEVQVKLDQAELTNERVLARIPA